MSSFDGIAALLEKHAPKPRPHLPPADEIRLAATRAAFHLPGKKYRTPKYVLAAVQREYDRLGSLQATADHLGVSKSNIFQLFKRHGLKAHTRTVRPKLMYKGQEYAFDGRYWWKTLRGHQGQSLHKRIWEEAHGPVPAGHRLILCGAPEDYRNVRCVPLADYYRHVVAQRWAKRTA